MDKIVCIVQARMSSTRFPGKIMTPILGYPMLYRVIQRVMLSKVKDIVVATSDNTEDNIISYMFDCYNLKNIGIFRGSDIDVLSRYIQAAESYKADALIRITADCPLIDYTCINEVIDDYNTDNSLEYIEYDTNRYLEGVEDIELIKTSTLKKVAESTVDYKHREHVTKYITDNRNKFKIMTKMPVRTGFMPEYHLSVDTVEDLNTVRRIYEHFSPKIDFTGKDILKYLGR